MQSLQSLPSLQHLNLDNNRLKDFRPSEPCRSLQTLEISDNELVSVDVAAFPKLQRLYLDKNRLTMIHNLDYCGDLDILSLREQANVQEFHLTLASCSQIRRLYLSENGSILSLTPSTPLLNLQHLELAACGLAKLPVDFARNFPNLRSLNLNFNGLKYMEPLAGIARLDKLYLAGNRVDRMRRTINVLGELSNLTVLDLRNNPLTVGFHTHNRQESGVVLHGNNADAGLESDMDRLNTLTDEDAEADAKHMSRLDEGTRLRRRVTQLLLATTCKRLATFDGLPLDRTGIDRKDALWCRLEELGVLTDPHTVQSVKKELSPPVEPPLLDDLPREEDLPIDDEMHVDGADGN